MDIMSFDNLDEAAAYMREAEKQAEARLTSAQREVSWGDCWVTYYREAGIWIFGEVFTPERNHQSSIKAGASIDEANEEDESLQDAHARGYRFGRAYSVACPEGELGSTHIANMLGKITPEELSAAMDCEWEAERLFASHPALMDRVLDYIAQIDAPEDPELQL